jgi:hypothetical protein
VTESAGHPAFSDTRGSANGQIVMSVDPVAAEQLHEERAIKDTLAAMIDIFRGRLVAQLGEPEACG